MQMLSASERLAEAKKAKAALAELEKYYPNDPRTFVAWGTVFAHEKKYDEARERYLRPSY